MHSSRPATTEYAPYFNRYIDLVSEADFVAVLARQPAEYAALLGALSQQQASFRYAPGKWSVREVVGHVVDAERVFGYRALCIARGESVSLPSFDENAYAAKAGHDACPCASCSKSSRMSGEATSPCSSISIKRLGSAQALSTKTPSPCAAWPTS